MESPCIDICSLDPVDELCAGCHRSIGEIIGWAGYTSAERLAIMAELPQRAVHRNETLQETATV